jgi:hypothetical protein
MSRILMISLAALLPFGLAFGAVAGGDVPESYSDGPEPYASGPSCDIRVVNEGGALVFEGLAFSAVPSSGSYDFKITQGGPAGGSNIEQVGDFEASSGEETSLGMVSLSNRGSYDATLTVRWHDGAPDCTRRVGSGRRL